MPERYPTNDVSAAQIIGRYSDDQRWSYSFSLLKAPGRARSTILRAERAIQILGPDREFLLVYYGSDAAGGFQTLDRPLRTITTIDKFALVRPNCQGHEMRMLQPPELAAAMGLPTDYKWPDGITRRDCIRLIGNAVCPPVMRAIVHALLKTCPKDCVKTSIA